jgi:hypothetical protein
VRRLVAEARPGDAAADEEEHRRRDDRGAEHTSAALDGVGWQGRERHLLTATDGTVTGCGMSGPATPDLATAFDQAFAG